MGTSLFEMHCITDCFLSRLISTKARSEHDSPEYAQVDQRLPRPRVRHLLEIELSALSLEVVERCEFELLYRLAPRPHHGCLRRVPPQPPCHPLERPNPRCKWEKNFGARAYANLTVSSLIRPLLMSNCELANSRCDISNKTDAFEYEEVTHHVRIQEVQVP